MPRNVGAIETTILFLALAVSPGFAGPQSQCLVVPTDYHGWKATRLSNKWISLVFVPQVGGRLMQVSFGGHEYLFVNPRYYGQYFPPSEGAAKGKWFNYGGDKIWPLPEGDQDESHWIVASDQLDDGVYQLVEGQDTAGIGMKNFSRTYRALGDYEVRKGYVERESLTERGLEIESLMRITYEDEDDDYAEKPSIRLVDRRELMEIMAQQDVILSF